METATPLDEHVTLLRLSGDVTLEKARQLHDECRDLLANRKRDFVIDLSRVGFIDSAGLEWLLWLQDTAGEVLGQVRLVGVQGAVAEILRITRLAPAFRVHDAADAAVQSLKV